MPPSYAMTPNYLIPPQVGTTISAPPVIQAQPSVISAPPQVAAPSQLAAAVKANKEAEAAAKLATVDDNIEVDDDVTRALLAAAAGVTYNHSTTTTTSASSATTTADTNSASTASSSTAGPKVVPSVPAKTVIVPQSLLPTQIASASRLSAIDQAKSRSKSSYTEELYPFQKKVYKRIAAGMVWEDPTLADWDPSRFMYQY